MYIDGKIQYNTGSILFRVSYNGQNVCYRGIRYRKRGWLRIPDVRNTKPAAFPITDVRYRKRSWFCITDVRYTKPAAFPIPDPPITDVLSVIGNTKQDRSCIILYLTIYVHMYILLRS